MNTRQDGSTRVFTNSHGNTEIAATYIRSDETRLFLAVEIMGAEFNIVHTGIGALDSVIPMVDNNIISVPSEFGVISLFARLSKNVVNTGLLPNVDAVFNALISL